MLPSGHRNVGKPWTEGMTASLDLVLIKYLRCVTLCVGMREYVFKPDPKGRKRQVLRKGIKLNL